MARGVRELLNGPAGRAVAAAAILGGMGLLYVGARDTFGRSEFAAAARERVFICAETGKTFRHEVKPGDTFPVPSPHSGKPTGHRAEACYWTADGKPKAEPTFVLLNAARGRRGPTFCQDCGRLVTEMNNPPAPGVAPPPTEAQLKTSRNRITPVESEQDQ